MLNKIKKLIFLLSVICVAFQAKAAEDYLINDLNNSWLIYNASDQTYLPLIDLTEKQHTFNLYIKLNDYKRFSLQVKTNAATEIYANQQLLKTVENTETVTIPIETLQEFTGENKVLLSFYTQNLSEKPSYAAIIRSSTRETGLNIFNYNLIRKDSELYSNLLLISLLSILVLIVILKSIDSEKLEIYFNMFRLFSNKKVDDYLFQNAFSGTTFPYLVSSAFIISVVLLINRYSFFSIDRFGIENGFLKLTGIVLINALIILALYLAKYIYLQFIGIFVSVRRFSGRHFFEFSRIFSIGFSLILVFSLFINSFNLSSSWLNIILLLFFILWLIRIAIVGRQELGFKNMYLFSYLCTSEIIPFILILKNIGTF